MVALIFGFDGRKGQGQVELEQTIKYVAKQAYIVQFCLSIAKMS